MLIDEVRIENFKLLKDVTIRFSTDRYKPLTLVRAENGSGKTSILYAMIWAFYGESGLPDIAKGLRLSSNAASDLSSVKVKVTVNFSHQQELLDTNRYRLIREVDEIVEDGKVIRSNEQFYITRLGKNGDDLLVDPVGFVEKIVPTRLVDVFFTNGDDVQRFISGQISKRERQGLVHESIKSLLGLDGLRQASQDIGKAKRQLEKEISKGSNSQLQNQESQLDAAEKKLGLANSVVEKKETEITNLEKTIHDWEKRLKQFSGNIDIDKLNKDISGIETELEVFSVSRRRIVSNMADSLKSSPTSWILCRKAIINGYKKLQEMVDNSTIPGISLGILYDRLDLGQCICGELLEEGTTHRNNVIKLLESQKENGIRSQKNTQLYHSARQFVQEHEENWEQEQYTINRKDLISLYSDNVDLYKSRMASMKSLEEKRRLVDPEKTEQIESRLSSFNSKLSTAREDLGGTKYDRDHWSNETTRLRKEFNSALDKTRKTGKQKEAYDVIVDLESVVKNTLSILETDYIKKVANRMNDFFLDIVGSDIKYEGSIFAGVSIDEYYNILIHTRDGKLLDPDFELNGASQRALTMSFIWALMEVSGTVAPRIIDTPLGMVAGGVKERLTNAITRPSKEVAFQVMLLLTRSEIRDIENILDTTMGKWQTISCSSHYPEDLLNDWGVDFPESRVCGCSHRESCVICARRYDDKHNVEYKGKRNG